MADRPPDNSPPERLQKAGFADEALPHLDAVYHFALRLSGGGTDEASDIAQETFLRAYRAWDSYTPGTNCLSWLFTICRNVFRRRYERGQRRRERPASDYGADVEALAVTAVFSEVRAADPEREFFESFVDEEVLRAVDQLPAEFREVVLLSDLQGLSYAEVAAVINAPLGTVKSRLYRGRRLLQQSLYAYALEMGYLMPEVSE